jgi:hypothetical protein
MTGLVVLWLAAVARAQQPEPSRTQAALPPEPFGIIDNSFLVEESFNQEPGTFQNIFSVVRSNGRWAAAFIQEWPLVTDHHQFSYSVSWDFGGGERAFGDTLVNYRFQALREGRRKPAFAPRLSAVLPTASAAADDAWGVQINLPFSKRTGTVYWHWNGGVTWLPSVGDDRNSDSLESPFLAGSAVYRLHPMFQLMFEMVANSNEQRATRGTDRSASLTASPGVRGGWNIGRRQQVVFGLALPTTWSSDNRREVAALLYASYELPYRK